MNSETGRTTEPTEPSAAACSSFAVVANRVARGATNLLVTGLILILGIIVGRHMLAAWGSKSAGGYSTNKHAIGVIPQASADEREQQLQFADFRGTLLRSEVSGDLSAACELLRRDCLQAAQASPNLCIGNGELQEWLAKLDRLQPVRHEPGRWKLYELRQPMPMAVAVTDSINPSGTANSHPSTTRVLSWGMAIPADAKPVQEAKSWTAFVISSATQRASARINQLALPATCARVIAMLGRSDAVIGFSSHADPGEVAASWDARALQETWRNPDPWQINSGSWHRRYEHSDGTCCDVQFAYQPGSKSTIVGFCLFTHGSE